MIMTYAIDGLALSLNVPSISQSKWIFHAMGRPYNGLLFLNKKTGKLEYLSDVLGFPLWTDVHIYFEGEDQMYFYDKKQEKIIFFDVENRQIKESIAFPKLEDVNKKISKDGTTILPLTRRINKYETLWLDLGNREIVSSPFLEQRKEEVFFSYSDQYIYSFNFTTEKDKFYRIKSLNPIEFELLYDGQLLQAIEKNNNLYSIIDEKSMYYAVRFNLNSKKIEAKVSVKHNFSGLQFVGDRLFTTRTESNNDTGLADLYVVELDPMSLATIDTYLVAKDVKHAWFGN